MSIDDRSINDGGLNMESSERGKNLSIDLKIGFREAVMGGKRSVSFSRLESCEFCQGKGICRKHWWSIFQSSCINCQGKGLLPKMKTVKINIPQGVTEERTLVLEAEGDAGERGADRGDLHCHLLLVESECFSRQGLDIISRLEVTQLQFDQGCSLVIDTINGLESIHISTSSCIDRLLRLEKRGFVRVLAPAGATVETPFGAFQLADAMLEEGDHLIHIVIAENPKPPPKFRDEDALDSQIGINYCQLRDYLRERQWHKADVATHNLMLQVCKRVETRETQGTTEAWLTEKLPEFSSASIGRLLKDFHSSSLEKAWLDETSINQFPCQDLRTIDQLWSKYSDGQFGFTAQNSVWQQCYRRWDNFEERVGWLGLGEIDVFVSMNTVKTDYGTRTEPKYKKGMGRVMVPYEKRTFSHLGELSSWRFLNKPEEEHLVSELLNSFREPDHRYRFRFLDRIQNCKL
jgi:hypothetical protein